MLLAFDDAGTLFAQTWRAADPDTVITTSTLVADLGIAPDQGWELRLSASLGAVRVDHYWELTFESVSTSPPSSGATTTTTTVAPTTTLAGQAQEAPEAPDVPVAARLALGDVKTLTYDRFESLDGWSAGGATISNGQLVSTDDRIERIERLGYGEAGLFRVSFVGSAMVRVGADAGSPTDADFERAAVILREGQPSWEFYDGGIKAQSYQLDIPIRPNVEYYVLVARSSTAVLVKVWNTGPRVVAREEIRGLTDASTLFVQPTEGLSGSVIVHEFWHLSFPGSLG